MPFLSDFLELKQALSTNVQRPRRLDLSKLNSLAQDVEKPNMGAPAEKVQWTTQMLFNLLKEFELLKAFPDHLITELSQSGEILDLSPNTQILQQGQMN